MKMLKLIAPFKTLNHKEVYLRDYRTLDDVDKQVPYFIEDMYTIKQSRLSFAYLSSDEP